MEEHKLRALVIVGGPADLTWAHHLSKHLPSVTVIGVPKSKNANFYFPYYLPITLGFDSSRWMLSELAGNVAIDSMSSRKYWHFIHCGDA